MRTVEAIEITKLVRTLCLDACTTLDEPLLKILGCAVDRESSPFGKEILEQILENACIAQRESKPICQDTGMAVLFVELGQDVHIVNGSLNAAINEGVKQAYQDGYFRNSVLTPLTRINTGDNTPAVIHLCIVDGEAITITVAPKGFGSENMSRLCMLTPAQGESGVMDFVVETVRLAGANPCPPVIVGVGIGGTMELACLMAKHALTRDAGVPSADTALAKMEGTLLTRINKLGIGPQGLGGNTTALAVHIESYPTHIAGLPVAVNMQCHVARHKCGTI